MSKLKIWEWKTKKRTLLKNIHPGDIFCLTKDYEKYHFGRIISKTIVGHMVEILNLTHDAPSISQESLENATLAIPPLVLDSYAILNRKIDSSCEWRMIGHQDAMQPERYAGHYFVYGTHNNWKKTNNLNEQLEISNTEALAWPLLTALNNYNFWIKISEEPQLRR